MQAALTTIVWHTTPTTTAATTSTATTTTIGSVQNWVMISCPIGFTDHSFPIHGCKHNVVGTMTISEHIFLCDNAKMRDDLQVWMARTPYQT